jgi:hypothetical protein
MKQSDAPAIGRVAFGAALAVCLLGWAPPVAGQAVPDCAAEKTLDVTLTSKEKGLAAPLVATHDVTVTAEFTGSTARESLTPPPDVRVLGRGRGGVIEFIVPVAASVPITVSWHQAKDPSDPASDPTDPSTRCAASRVVTLTVEPARRSRAVRTSGWRQGFSDFAVVPALKRPDLSPLEISARTTARVRFPSAKAKPRTMVVPMRTVDQIKYRTRLPGLAGITVAKICRFYLLTCGSVFSEVSRLLVDTDALRRGIVKGDLNGAVSLLARTQPSREAARYGVSIQARPGGVRVGAPRPFGYDVRVRQSGRRIARVRAAGRCVERRGSQGLFTQCRIRRRSTQLR